MKQIPYYVSQTTRNDKRVAMARAAADVMALALAGDAAGIAAYQGDAFAQESVSFAGYKQYLIAQIKADQLPPAAVADQLLNDLAAE